MMKFCIEQWDKNKQKFENDVRENFKDYNEKDYLFIVKKVVELILNDDEEYPRYSANKITEIDHGDYQGTLLYMIPVETYQPSEYDYLMTYIGYGSCSGCDYLQGIQTWSEPDDEEYKEERNRLVKGMSSLAKDILQNMIRPYNTGWRIEEKFNHAEDYVEENLFYE